MTYEHKGALDISLPHISEFLRMHTYCRPAGSKTEQEFIATYIDALEGMTKDTKGNRILRIGTAPVMWSCHTDTVHAQGGRQKLAYGDGMLSLSKAAESTCLGADCTVGVWLMRNMILRNVEGLYIFHAAEEVGGIGSRYIADETPELLKGIDWAIALDRKGTNSVITEQFGVCCSDGFAKALAAKLGDGFEADDTGVFTDTANYIGLIPECTNISVGYRNQHTKHEFTDVAFAVHLLEVLCNLDTSDLPVLRDPTVTEYSWYGGWKNSNNNFKPTLADLVYKNPSLAAEILEACGVDIDMFEQYLTDDREERWRGHN